MDMKYYEQLLRMEVFNLAEVEQLTGSIASAKNLLDRYVKKGFVKKVRRNLYYCVNLENKNSTANRFVIGSNINNTTFISHHSAFEYYGLAHQTFYELNISSEKLFRNFDFEGITYKYVRSHFEQGVMTPETNSKIRVTNLERTVIDCIQNIKLSGGTEELFQCLDSVLILNNDRLFEYLILYDIKFLYQKAGYIFEKYQKNFNVKDEIIKSCQQQVSNSIRYFDEDAREGNGSLIKKWNLIVPKNIEKDSKQGAVEFV
jgi:predicted transcriptional regulator of viral defense system